LSGDESGSGVREGVGGLGVIDSVDEFSGNRSSGSRSCGGSTVVGRVTGTFLFGGILAV